jgi:ATP-dependent RNA helicase DDX10/DBP4
MADDDVVGSTEQIIISHHTSISLITCTYSGKTLAFVVPVLEALYRNKITPTDGTAAILMSPTRELAVQIFHVLKTAGKFHSFSVGLLIGGRKDFYEEQERLATTNIVIATPGRLLQHLEQTPHFDCTELKVLVLDECDRILDLGFRDQLVRILDYLPTERQTLLFSATQTRDVSHLATLSLVQPEYLGVHDKEKTVTPESLDQSYIVLSLEHKLNAVYSFIKSHLKNKSIVFMGSCAQVRHAWELFCLLRPGLPIMALHGKLGQEKRTHIYFDFLNRPRAVLFCTDICARGLDFPDVDWVLQVDAPEDRDMYIHRVGRTARYRSGGKSLLMVTPAEEKNGFVDMVQGNSKKENLKIPLKKLSINPTKTVVVTQRAASLVASNVSLNLQAKKAYKSYVRSIALMPRKDIFRVDDLPLDEYSKSLGLASTPNLRFIKNQEMDRDTVREKKNVNYKLQRLKEQIKAEKLARKLRKMGKSETEIEKALSAGKETASGDVDEAENDSSDDEVLVAKTEQTWNLEEELDDDVPYAGVNEVSQSRHPKKIRLEGSNVHNKRIVFGDDGEVIEDNVSIDHTAVDGQIDDDKRDLAHATESYAQKIRDRLKSNKEEDRLQEKERVKQKHKRQRLQEKTDKEESDQALAVLKAASDSESESSSDDDSSNSNSGSDSSALNKQEELALSLIRG